jgi:hypothetical protein
LGNPKKGTKVNEERQLSTNTGLKKFLIIFSSYYLLYVKAGKLSNIVIGNKFTAQNVC